MGPLGLLLALFLILLSGYLCLVEYRLRHTPAELQAIAGKADTSSTDWRHINILDYIPSKRPGRDLRYVVTGGSGITGSWIIRHLMKRGERYIRCLDVKPLPHDLEDADIDFCFADLRSANELKAALLKPWSDGFVGIDVVYHIAGNIRWWETWHFQKELSFSTNVRGTLGFLAQCEELNVETFIYLSSGSVVQDAANWWALPGLFKLKRYHGNTDPTPTPCCHYSASKAEAETEILKHTGRMKTGVIRPAQTIFGGGGSSGGVSAGLWPEKNFNLTFNGTIVQDLVYVENISIGCLLLEKHLIAAASGCRFTITNDELRYYRYLTDVIQKYSHKKHHFTPVPVVQFLILAYLVDYSTYLYWFLTGRQPNFGELAYLAPSSFSIGQTAGIWDCQDAKEVLGYKPAFSVAQGARKYIEEWKIADDIARSKTTTQKILTYHDF